MAVKLISLPLVLFCAVLVVPEALAQNCRLSVSQPRIDYGVIRRDGPFDRPTVALATRSLQLNVLCAEPAAVALRFIGVPADGQGFRFGHQGRFWLSLKHAQVDGQAVALAAAQRPGEPANGQLLPGQTLVAHTAGRQFTAQVDIDTELPAGALHVRGETYLEGQGSFELVSPAAPQSR